MNWSYDHISPWDDHFHTKKRRPSGTPCGPTIPPNVDSKLYRQALKEVENLCGCDDCKEHPWNGPTLMCIHYI